MTKLKLTILLALLFNIQFVLLCKVNEQYLLSEITKLKFENNFSQAAALFNKLVFNYWENEQYQKALQSFEQSVALNKETGNNIAIKTIYCNMGMIYSDLGHVEISLVFLEKVYC